MIKNTLPETLSSDVVEAAGLMSFHDAIENIHFPKTMKLLRDAEFRLKFEELFYIQLNIVRYAADRKEKLKGVVFSKVGNYLNSFYKDRLLSFNQCTKRVIKEIRSDTATGQQMNRLLQGTWVAERP